VNASTVFELNIVYNRPFLCRTCIRWRVQITKPINM